MEKKKAIRRQLRILACVVLAFVAGEFGVIIVEWIIDRSTTSVEQTTTEVSFHAAPELSLRLDP
jgi:hypothetical protein